MKMASKTDNKKYVCIREKQIGKHETDITELKTRAEFKEQQIKELNENMHEVNQKLDEIKDGLQELKLTSVQGDSDIDNRVTALESTVKTLKWVSGISLTALSVLVAALAFAITHLH